METSSAQAIAAASMTRVSCVQVASDSRVLTAASGAFLLLTAASWVSNRSGFAGDLDPQQALDLLRSRNACLIDTRCG